MAQKNIIGDIVMYKNRIHTIIDILASNGYELSYVRHPVIKNANYVVLEFTEDGIYAYINEKTMLFTIKYIHELQHLLFGFGINHEMEV